MPLSEYKIFMEALNYYNESYDLAFEDAMADKLKDLLGATLAPDNEDDAYDIGYGVYRI